MKPNLMTTGLTRQHTAAQQPWRRRALVLLLIVGLLGPLLPLPGPAHAQGDGARLRILRVDAGRAPVVDVYVAADDGAGRTLSGLTPSNFHLFDNGKPVALASATPIRSGLQLALVIDASGSINGRGLTGQTRMDEAREALATLLTKGNWLDVSGRSDWVMLMAQRPGDLQTLTADARYPQGWTNDYQMVYNQAYLYDSSDSKGATPLLDAVLEAIRQMSLLPAGAAAPEMPRALIVFSDGASGASRAQVADVTDAAERAHVVIHSVTLGAAPNTGAGSDLERLSAATGGVHARYDSARALDALYRTLPSLRTQYHLQYRMASAGAHFLQIQADTGLYGAAAANTSFSDGLEPPQITVTAPAPGAAFEKQPAAAGAAVEPTLPVTVEIGWQGAARGIAEVDYLLDETRFTVTRAPFDHFELPLKDVSDGRHTLRAEMVDELGLRAASADVPFTVRSLQPLSVSFVNIRPGMAIRRETPRWWISQTEAQPKSQPLQVTWTATDGRPRTVLWVEYLIDGQPYRVFTNTMETFAWDISRAAPGTHYVQVRLQDNLGLTAESQPVPVDIVMAPSSGGGIGLLLAMLMAVAALGLVAVLLVRKRDTLASGSRAVASRIRAATQPWHPERMARRRGGVEAQLVVEEGDDRYPQPIPLLSANTRIGRDESLVNVHFEDMTVSRLHARISKEQDGSFRVYDEGSTSGTYVNNQRVPMAGQLLQPDDIIQIGRVCLRFARNDGARRAPAPPLSAPAYNASPLPRRSSEEEDPYDTEPWRQFTAMMESNLAADATPYSEDAN